MWDRTRAVNITRRSSLYAAWIGLGLTIVFTSLAEFEKTTGNRSFIYNLTAQFRWQYFGALIVLGVVFFFHKRPLIAAICVSFALLNMMRIGPIVGSSTRPAGSSPVKLRILQINANSRNFEFDPIINYVRDTNPALLLVPELNPELAARIPESLSKYRFNIIHPLNNPNGKVINFGDGRVGVSCKLEIDGRSLSFVGVHLTGPTNQNGWVLQNIELKGLTDECRQLPTPLIVAGDFNSTPWTKRFQSLLKSLNLTDTRRDFGLQLSWPSDCPITKLPLTHTYRKLYLPFIHRLVMLPIDHFLVSRELVTVNRTIGPNVGSDHYPVLVELTW